MDISRIIGDYKNFVFIGGTGSGKSELAINMAKWIKNTDENVQCHMFDLDMTKPLFRSRDIKENMEHGGIQLHFQEQFMDAPTLVGGIRTMLKDTSVYTLLDIGGDYIGARSIGGFVNELNRTDTKICYLLNACRPWMGGIEHIDETMGQILGVSHIPINKLCFINNSNLGVNTTVEEFLNATEQLEKILLPYAQIDFSLVRENIYNEVAGKIKSPVYPVELFLSYL